ncbi:hypothetical protein KR044_001642, partial [Drosophila immigrans]
DDKFPMRYESLALILILSIVLMATSKPVCTRKSTHYYKKQRSGLGPSKNLSFCRIDLNSTSMASKAANEAKAAKDAQACASVKAGQRVMEQLANKAELAARAVQAALNGKKILLDQLEINQNETVAVIQEVKRSLKNSRVNIETIARLNAQIQQTMEQIQCFREEAEENLAKIREAAEDTKKDVEAKHEKLELAEERSCNLKSCFMKAKEDLELTEMMAEQAESAARESTERINAVQDALKKIKRLRRKDDKSLREVIYR